MAISCPSGRMSKDDVKKTMKAGKKGNPFAGKQAAPFGKGKKVDNGAKPNPFAKI